jgi:hypothetical protein
VTAFGKVKREFDLMPERASNSTQGKKRPQEDRPKAVSNQENGCGWIDHPANHV